MVQTKGEQEREQNQICIHEDKQSQGEHETENHNTRQDTCLTEKDKYNKTKIMQIKQCIRFLIKPCIQQTACLRN